jgi:hypothetical protein
MENIENIAAKNLEKALKIIQELQIKEIWEKQNSTCNLVGSVKKGLLMTHLDIDFHVYSNDFSIGKSFNAISQISKNQKIKEVLYKNLLEDEDMCLEWHLSYQETPVHIWTIDIIHIKNESPYAGIIERVTEKINSILTEKKRQNILKIKWECERQKEKIHGIEIYQAVIDENIETFDDFKMWKQNKKNVGISLWEPEIK